MRWAGIVCAEGCQDLARTDDCVDEAGGHRRQRTAGQANRKENIRQKECDFCRRERASKARVASGMDDPRFHEAKFVEAPAIFANNDVKYEANKKRSRLFAEHRKSTMLYVRAQDTPSAEVLRDRPRVAEEIQDHDKHGASSTAFCRWPSVCLRQLPTTSIGIPRNRCCEGRSVSCTLGYWKTESRWSTRTDKRC